MYLESTPHVTIRNRNGLKNIDYTACDILGLDDDSSTAAARSYNTIIGVYTEDESGNKIYLETSGVYSTTTASKHKPRAAAIAAHNGFKIIPGIKPAVLHDLYFYPSKAPAVEEILKEVETKKQLLNELKENVSNSFLQTALKVDSIITPSKEPESTPYKNDNRLVKYYYSTNFKYVSNISYERNQKEEPVQVQTRTGPAVTARITNKIVNIEA